MLYTRVYIGIPGYTKVYMGIKVYTRVYMGIQGCTRGIQRVYKGYTKGILNSRLI